MTDIVDKSTRSRMMSGIRSSNTKPEITIRKALHRLGYRYSLVSKVGKIKPDVVLRRHRVAVFVHGCYWHQHEDCRLAYSDRPKSAEWEKKLSVNKARDKRVTEQLLSQGWRVVVIWECVTRNADELYKEIRKLHKWIESGKGDYYESKYRKV